MQKDVLRCIHDGLTKDWARTQLEFKDGHESPTYFIWAYHGQTRGGAGLLEGEYSSASLSRCVRRLTARGLVEWPDRSKYIRPQVAYITLTEEGRKVLKTVNTASSEAYKRNKKKGKS